MRHFIHVITGVYVKNICNNNNNNNRNNNNKNNNNNNNSNNNNNDYNNNNNNNKTYHFVPLACETLGPINNSGHLFITEMGRCLSRLTGDTRETSHFYQRISITIQRFNAIAFQGSFVLQDLAE